MISEWFAKLTLAACALIAVGVSLLTKPPIVFVGISDAAAYVLDKKAERMLYCGRFDGSFCFAVRARAAPFDQFVLRGDKLKRNMFEPQRFEDFLFHYGIDYVLVERNQAREAWDRVLAHPPASLKLEKKIELRIPSSKWDGDLLIFRFPNPSSDPADPTRLQLSTIGGYLGKFSSVHGLTDAPPK